jgi:cytoskeletal protein CcmA (bactofilin family)
MSALQKSLVRSHPKRAFNGGRADEEMVSVVARDVRVEGTLNGSGVIRIEGTVVGKIRAEHQVLVSKDGTVEGDVYAQEAILGGAVKGSIFADGRVEVQATAEIHGEIKTPYLVVHEGATVCGPVHMLRHTETGEPVQHDSKLR